MPSEITPAVVPEADLEAFFQTANRFLDKANALAQSESRDIVAAAFLYACARYNAFAMQAQAGDPTAVGAEFADFLIDRFEQEVREHMAEALSSTGAEPQHGKHEYLATMENIQNKENMVGENGTWYYYLKNDPLGKVNGWYAYDKANSLEVE